MTEATERVLATIDSTLKDYEQQRAAWSVGKQGEDDITADRCCKCSRRKATRTGWCVWCQPVPGPRGLLARMRRR